MYLVLLAARLSWEDSFKINNEFISVKIINCPDVR